MAEALYVYGTFPQNLMSGKIADLSGGTQKLKVALLKRTHTFNQSNDNWGQIKADEITDADYSAKEITVNVSYSSLATLLEAPTDCSFGAEVTITAGYAVIYDGRPATDANRKLVGIIDFGAEKSSVDGNFKIEFGKVGEKTAILKFTAAAPA